uniref:Uncharacterized protein n=1 Tax=Solanum tuberosum TaxID=4113 RepID=M1DWG0_SOLTU
MGAEAILCALIYENLKALGILNTLEGVSSEVEPENAHKTCAYHKDQKGHTIEECVELKTAIRDLINFEKITYMWGHYTVFTCDKLDPGMSATEHTFCCHYFTPFEDSLRASTLNWFEAGFGPLTKRRQEWSLPLEMKSLKVAFIMALRITTLKHVSCSVMMWNR